jgi:recombination protein RecT
MASADGKDLVKSPYDWIEKARDKYLGLIPKDTINVDRLIRTAILAISEDEKLKKCSMSQIGRQSILKAIADIAECGLEVKFGEAWLICYNDSVMIKGQKTKTLICHFQIGYQGMLKLAYRSGMVKAVHSDAVYEKDEVEADFGYPRKLSVRPKLFTNRGKITGYVSVVELTTGSFLSADMSVEQIEEHKKKWSKSADMKDSAWDSSEETMSRNTVLKKALKYGPKSKEIEKALSSDDDMRNVTEAFTENDFNLGFDKIEETDQEVEDDPANTAKSSGENSPSKGIPPKEFKF